MRTKRLEIAYRLTGSGIAPSAVTPPYTINHALSEAGLLTDRFSGMGALECEWAYNRAFALEGALPLDDWRSERTYLEFERLAGRGIIYVNGEAAGEFADGPLELDITGCVRAGANSLRLEFAPGETRGILGGAALRGCWSLHIRSWALSSGPDSISARVDVSAHAAGRYVFRYAVSCGEEALGAFEFEEQLGARHARLEHTLRKAAQGSPRTMRVLLTVLRAGDACDERVGWIAPAAAPARAPRTVALADGEAMAARLDALLDAGAQRFYAREGAYLPEAFLCRADEAGVEVISPCAARTPHACLRAPGALPEPTWIQVTGMRRLAPPGRPLPDMARRALGMDDEFAEQMSGALGGCALGDIARLSRIARYLQAQYVGRAAEADAEAAFDLGGGWGRIVSSDLFDEGRPRPAYYALRAAWREHGVYARPDGIAFAPGATVSVPIFARGRFERVRAELYDSRGRVLSRAEFISGGEGHIGELTFVTAGECAACLLRLTGWRADGVCLRDYPMLTRGECELEALERLEPAQVKRKGDQYINMADIIAFGPVREDGGSALLPGERCPLLLSEGVNVFEYEAPDA